MVRELATGRPRNLPYNFTMPRIDIPSFTTLVQGRYTGKTRFLLEQIKEDQEERSFVIYFTMKSKGEEGRVTSKGMDMLLRTMDNLNLYKSSIYFIDFYKSLVNEIVDEQGYLKAEYSKWGGYHADCILKNMATPFEFNERSVDQCPIRELCFKPHDDPTAPTKRLHVVLVIDEAHHLLKQKRTLKNGDLCERDGLSFIDDTDHVERKDGEVSLFSMIRRIVRYCNRIFCFRIPFILASSSPRVLQTMRCEIYYGCGYESDFTVSKDDEVMRVYRQPMILRETMNLWSRQIKVDKSYLEYIRSEEFAYNLGFFGRPIWGALMKTSNLNKFVSYNMTVYMAEMKFLSENRTTPLEVKSLAFLGHTVFIEPLSLDSYGTVLVEAKMGFLKADDDCRQHFVAVVHPEPLLSIVATMRMFHMTEMSLYQCLKRFRDMSGKC